MTQPTAAVAKLVDKSNNPQIGNQANGHSKTY